MYSALDFVKEASGEEPKQESKGRKWAKRGLGVAALGAAGTAGLYGLGRRAGAQGFRDSLRAGTQIAGDPFAKAKNWNEGRKAAKAIGGGLQRAAS